MSSIEPARSAVDELDVSEELREVTRLVVSELVANAVLHAGEECVLVLDVASAHAVRVEVIDDGPGYDLVAELHQPPRVHCGRGLRIVAALSRDLSAQRRAGRTHTCCVVEAP